MDDHLHDDIGTEAGKTRHGMRRWRRRPAGRSEDWNLLRREIDRSRRHGHPLMVVRVDAGTRADAVRLQQALETHVRSIDAVWTHADSAYIMLPESDRAAGDGFLGRLRAAAPELVPADAVRVACFPQDGLTADALRSGLEAVEDDRTSLTPLRPTATPAPATARLAGPEHGDGLLRRID